MLRHPTTAKADPRDLAAAGLSILSLAIAYYWIIVLLMVVDLYRFMPAFLGTVGLFAVGIAELAFLVGVPGILAGGARPRERRERLRAKIWRSLAALAAAAAVAGLIRFGALRPLLVQGPLAASLYWDPVHIVVTAVGASLSVVVTRIARTLRARGRTATASPSPQAP
jgi:hypothetical protein